jgi:hypothetical protein
VSVRQRRYVSRPNEDRGCRCAQPPANGCDPSGVAGIAPGYARRTSRPWILCRILAGLVLFFTASQTRADEPLNRRDKGDLAIQARGILKKYCSECHGGEPGRRGTILVLEHPNLVANGPNPVPFVLPGNPAGSQIVQFIEDGSMPPGNRARPTTDDLDILKKWIAAMAPSYPVAFDNRNTLKVILDDIDRQPANAVPHLRYFSLAHLVIEDGPQNDLGKAENNLRIALKWCNPEVRTAPEPVDDTATLFRFDTRTMGWDSRELFFSSTKGTPAGLHSLSPYDLILLEYPHGFRLPPENSQTIRLNQYFKKARLIQPIPFLRADWLAEKLGKGTPLAEDLKSLVELQKSLKKQDSPALGNEINMPCGPETRAFAGRNPIPSAPKPEASLPVLPLGSWYSGDCRAEPPAFTLKAEAVNANNLQPVKAVTKETPFRLQVTTDRDVHFVLLAVMSDGTVRVQPTNQGSFLKAGEPVILLPLGGEPFKIPSILTGEPKANEYFVLLASATELPTPVIVKSRHAPSLNCEGKLQFPISRFFFDPDTKKEGFDPARVVRVVIPITVTAD